DKKESWFLDLEVIHFKKGIAKYAKVSSTPLKCLDLDSSYFIQEIILLSLISAASHWLRNEPTGSIKTWEDLKTKFLTNLSPPGQTAKKMEEINNFQQESDETLFQAWERFKELLMKCPQHYLTEMHETAEDAKKVIQEMASILQKGILDEKLTVDFFDWLLYKHN
ncbi:reverse transcriptase domain-containing protein, partial [Tanacetum coccineum]